MIQQAGPGMAALLAALQENPSVPEGWDVVLNLSQPAMQSLVQNNWRAVSPPDQTHSLRWLAAAAVDGQHQVVEVTTQLPPPTVGLSVDGQSVQIDFAIDSGTQRAGQAPADLVARLPDHHSVLASGGVSWMEPVAITQQSPLQLAGSIPVAVERAADGRSFAIGLNLAAGHLALSGAGIADEAVGQSPSQWLAAHRFDGRIANLTAPDGAGATVLTPAKVTARVATSHQGQPVLQILTGASAGATVPPASAPAPHPGDYDFSLLVSSKAAMAMIANGYNLGTGIIKLASVPPQDGQVHWFVEVHEPMVFEGTFGNQNGDVYLTDSAKLFMRFGGSPDQDLKLFTYIDPSSTVQLQLELAAHYPTQISGTGTGQVVGLQEGAQSVTGHGFYEAIVQPQLATFLNGDIRSDMSKVRMTPLSDLALRDLSLSGHGLQFEIAALPAELVVAGSLVRNA